MFPDKGEKYTCANCGKVKVNKRSTTAVIAESERETGELVTERTHTVICNKCYDLLLKWEEEEKRKMGS